MAKFVPQPELSLNDQMQIRREKLAALQVEGRDPFVQTKFDFNADSAAIKADYEAFEGKTVKVAGRLMSKRGSLPRRYSPAPWRDGHRPPCRARQRESGI